MSAIDNNLPVPLSSFIGRERELADVKRLVSASRLVTLTGAGGCGKTRLAIQVANTISAGFADGVCLVDFVPLREPGLVPLHVAQAFGLRPASSQPLIELLRKYVQPKQMLLVLDNCEHLIADCAPLVHELLAAAPALNVLTTSRQLLAVAGELTYNVQGLAWPSLNGAAVDPEALMHYDAIHLFVERARAISPHFSLTAENAPAVVEICQRLDGIPLALELASARLNILTPQQIAARLDDRFALLTSSHDTALTTHHRTLRAAIDWSHTLLGAEEQALLRRLAVFDAGFSLDTAESVCAWDGIPSERVLDLLSSLVNKSLVVSETLGRAEARYQLLETIREYALEKLNEAGEGSRLRHRHLEFFVARAEEIEPKLRGTPYQNLWRNWLYGELDNLRAALGWALQSGQIEAGLRLAAALFELWNSRGSMAEGRAWLERFLAQTDERVPALLRARAAMYAGFLAGFMGDMAGAGVHEKTMLALCESLGEEKLELLALAQSPKLLTSLVDGDFATAFEIVEKSISLFRKSGNDYELIMALGTQAFAATAMGKYQVAHALADEALMVGRKTGDPYRTALILLLLGRLEHCEKHYERAQAYVEKSLEDLRWLGGVREEADAVLCLAFTRLQQRDFKQAHALFRESVALHEKYGNPKAMADCLIGFGAMASECGMQAEAVRLLTASFALGGFTVSVLFRAPGMEYERYLGAARARLTEQAFEQAQRDGRAWTLEQALDYAHSLPLTVHPPEPPDEFGGLTEREREIAALIAQGKRNHEIAGQLVLSQRTVEKHVANILSKLGLSNRAQIVRWALEQHLTKRSS